MGAGRTNYEALRERFLKRQEQKDTEGGWWKPEIGNRYSLRFGPPLAPAEIWFVEYGVHYNLWRGEENATETCPRLTLQKPCPVCEFVKTLWRGSEEDKAMARDIGAKRRYCANVFILSSDSPKVAKIWAFGPQVFDQIMEQTNTDDGVVPIDDPDQGYNMNLSVGKKATGDRVFPAYTISLASLKPSALADPKMLDGLVDIVSMIHGKIRGYDEIRAQLQGGDAPSETAEEAPPATAPAAAPAPRGAVVPRGAASPVAAPATAPATGTQEDNEEVIDDGGSNAEATPAPAAAPEGSSDLVTKARAALAKRNKK